MHVTNVPKINEILSACGLIRKDWSAHKRVTRRKQTTARQRQLMQQLLAPPHPGTQEADDSRMQVQNIVNTIVPKQEAPGRPNQAGTWPP
jgi:hypothetical protein